MAMAKGELTARLNVRLKECELSEVKEQADAAGLSLAEYTRRRVLGRLVASKVELRMLAELRSLSGFLKSSVESQGVHSEMTAEAIRALADFAKVLAEKHTQTDQLKRTVEDDLDNSRETKGREDKL